MVKIPQPPQTCHDEAQYSQHHSLTPRGHFAAFEQHTGKSAAHYAHHKRQTAENPGVAIPRGKFHRSGRINHSCIAKTPQYAAVNPFGQVAIGRIVTATEAIDGNPLHRPPIAQQQGKGYENLRFPRSKHKEQCGKQIAHGNALKGVRVEVNARSIETKQIALTQHTKQPQQHKTLEQTAKQFAARSSFPVARHGKGIDTPDMKRNKGMTKSQGENPCQSTWVKFHIKA